jgi:glycosyltransferase involved in cell wall biosynthesis
MNVWLLKDGEHLPIQPDARRMRTWMLADELVKHRHSVTWWASTHSHQRKALLFNHDHDVDIGPSFRLKLLFAGSYKSNRSARRLIHHLRLANRFRHQAPTLPRPDIIVSSFPTIELAFQAVAFAKRHGVPVIVDIRDWWPDTFVQLVPRYLRAPASIGLGGLHRQTRECFAWSDSLVASSQGLLDWGLKKAGMARRSADRVFYLGSIGRLSTNTGISPRICELRGKLADKVVFCFVGSFGHVYELGLVCEAAAILERQGQRHVHFVFAGDGQQFEKISSVSRSLSNLTLLGWLNASELDDLLSIADVGLAPIRQLAGSVPNKFFEYSAAGLPILSSLEGEAAEILSKYGAGLSYEPGNLQALVSHVMRLSRQNEERQRQARQSSAMFEQEFLASRIYGEYVNHVESIASSTSR